MKTYTIPKKMSGTGSIHDIASTDGDREICFPAGAIYAVVLADYYGGKGYTTHRDEEAAARQAAEDGKAGYSHDIIDAEGNRYIVSPGYYGDTLIRS